MNSQDPVTSQPELTKETLFLALKTLSGSSNNSSNIKESETALLCWENSNPSLYVDYLIQAIHESIVSSGVKLAPSIDFADQCHSIALLSLLSIKASVKRHWKPILSKRKVMIPFTEEMKWTLRSFLLSLTCPNHMNENMPNVPNLPHVDYSQFRLWTNRNFQNNVSALLSKIGRIDLPHQFPQLIPTLVLSSLKKIPSMTETVSLFLPNIIASHSLNELLLELSTKRLLVDKKYFISVAQQSIPQIAFIPNQNDAANVDNAVYYQLLQSICINVSRNSFDENNLEYAVYLTDILHKFMYASFSTLDQTFLRPIMSFLLDITTQLLNALVSMSTPRIGQNSKLLSLLDSLLDIPIQLQKQHPKAFINCTNTVLNEQHETSTLALYLKLFYSILLSIKNQNHIQTSNTILNTVESKNNIPSPTLPNFILLHAIQFFSNVASCDDYKHSPKNTKQYENDTVQTNSHYHDLVWNQFFSESTLNEITELLLQQLMPLSPNSNSSIKPSSGELGLLEIWSQDPESYILVELGEGTPSFPESSSGNNYENNCENHYDLRNASQNLYLALMESGEQGSGAHKIIGNHIASFLADSQSQFNVCSLEAASDDKVISKQNTPNSQQTQLVKDRSVLIWDAIFTAAGIAVNSLTEFVDWNIWWRQSLGPCLSHLMQSQGENPYLPVLRCRIIWLIGCHAHLVSPEMYLPTIDTLIKYFLSQFHNKNDAAVTFTTIQTLISLLYEPPQGDESIPFCIPATLGTSAINSMYGLMQRDYFIEVESRRAALTLTSALLTQVTCGSTSAKESHDVIIGLLRAAITPLYSMWKSCTENHQSILKKDLFSIVSCTISAIGRLIPDPHQWIKELYGVIVPMIHAALDPLLREENMHLEEDALSVWLMLMRMSTFYDEQLHNLFVRVSELVQLDLEHLRYLALLTESYILLGNQVFLNSQALNLSIFLSSTICKVRPKGALYITLVLEALLRKYPAEGGHLLLQGGIVTNMLQSCMWNYLENEERREVDSVIVLHLTVFARMLLADSRCMDICFPVKDQNGIAFDFKPENLLDQFFRLFDSAGYGTSGRLRRKVWALFIVSILPPSQSIFSQHVLREMDQVVNICVDVITENNDQGSANGLAPHEISYDSDDETIDVDTNQHKKLKEADFFKDPAFHIDVAQFVRAKLNDCAQALGESQFQEVIASVEPVIFQQLQKAIQ